jgi:hypothetical protein
VSFSGSGKLKSFFFFDRQKLAAKTAAGQNINSVSS